MIADLTLQRAAATPAAFSDPELSSGKLVKARCGKRLVAWQASGASKVAVRVRNGRNDYCVALFREPESPLVERQPMIEEALGRVPAPWKPPLYEFQERGILVDGSASPLIKQSFCNGVSLRKFLETASRSESWQLLRFGAFAQILERRQLAHGDLRSDNLLVEGVDGRLVIRAIDWDSMWAPQLAKLSAPGILGDPAFQHPERFASDLWTPCIDRFSCWSIYASILAVHEFGPSILDERSAGGLVFAPSDYENPGHSQALDRLRESGVDGLAHLADALRHLFELPLAAVPPLRPLHSRSGKHTPRELRRWAKGLVKELRPRARWTLRKSHSRALQTSMRCLTATPGELRYG